MKAMVFAAGLGTRLKPFTDHHPKALAEIDGHPMLGLVIEKLKTYGVTEIIVNVHHFANQIIDYLKNNNDFGVKIHISDETDRLLDTGGGILAARKWLNGNRFIVHNADILTDFDLDDMYNFAKSNTTAATLLVADRKTKRYLLFDPNDYRMEGWTNIETGQVCPSDLRLSPASYLKLAFGGVHVLSPDIFPSLEAYASKLEAEYIPKFSIMDFYISYCKELKIFGYEPLKEYNWHDIGKPESLEAATESFKNSKLKKHISRKDY